MFLSHQVGAFIGVWLGGAVYDATGGYDLMWWLSIMLGLAAAIVHLPISERRVVGAGGGDRMSRARHALLITALTLVAMGGTLWQVDQSGAVAQKGELPKLICPLH